MCDICTFIKIRLFPSRKYYPYGRNDEVIFSNIGLKW